MLMHGEIIISNNQQSVLDILLSSFPGDKQSNWSSSLLEAVITCDQGENKIPGLETQANLDQQLTYLLTILSTTYLILTCPEMNITLGAKIITVLLYRNLHSAVYGCTQQEPASFRSIRARTIYRYVKFEQVMKV
ncbi:hypothetical protein KC19_3G121700 [Ceratodon purpureus]|uniref:Uncharacterized protein n=1 Tax=Ceratodon purpureus TaxID=3225 RepID=A0A8T0IJX8_CERPU|nr:hypothetical protein KC19_3G121700 [Ceratodon purpureus]